MLYHIPNKWGISLDKLDKISDESFTKRRMDNNIRYLTQSDVSDILMSIYK